MGLTLAATLSSFSFDISFISSILELEFHSHSPGEQLMQSRGSSPTGLLSLDSLRSTGLPRSPM